MEQSWEQRLDVAFASIFMSCAESIEPLFWKIHIDDKSSLDKI